MPRQPGQDAGEIAVAVEHWTYPGSTKKMRRPILMQMMGGKDLVSWARFFSTLHGRPDVIVIDGDGGADAAIEDLAGEKEANPCEQSRGAASPMLTTAV